MPSRLWAVLAPFGELGARRALVPQLVSINSQPFWGSVNRILGRCGPVRAALIESRLLEHERSSGLGRLRISNNTRTRAHDGPSDGGCLLEHAGTQPTTRRRSSVVSGTQYPGSRWATPAEPEATGKSGGNETPV